MSGSSLGMHRIGTAFALSAAVFGCMMVGPRAARADELPGLNGGPPPILDRADDAAAPRAQATANPNAPPASPPVNTEAAPPPPGKRAARAQARKFEHWEIAPTLQYTISSGGDVIPQTGTAPPNDLPYDLLRITGDARYRFNKHLGLMYQRIAHTGSAGRQYKKGKPSYGGSGYDYEERELATWQFDPFLTYRAGYHYRARVCCPGAGDPNGIPRFLGGFFTDLSWRLGPDTIGGKPITTSFRWEQNYHRFTAAAQKNLARGDYDSGQKPTFAYTLYSNFYFYHQTKLVPYYGIEYFSTYFSNNPHMSVTYRKVYGMAYRATSDLTWRFYVKNDQPNGLAAGPDTSHKSTSFLEATYRFHR